MMTANLVVPGAGSEIRHAVSIPNGLDHQEKVNDNLSPNVQRASLSPRLSRKQQPITLSVPSAPPRYNRAKSEPFGSPVKKRVSSGRRVNLGPGCGMLDWVRLTRNTKDIAGTGGKLLTVTEEELAKHCTEEDAWTCVRGKVYNITPYFKFHPGGKPDLLKSAGIDSTILFDEVHSWVNIESMMAKCLVGHMETIKRSGSFGDSRRNRSGSFTKRTAPTTLKVGQLTNGLKELNVNPTEKPFTSAKQVSVPPMIAIQRDVKPCDEPADTASHTPQSPIKPPLHVSEEEDVDSSALTMVPPSPVRKNSDASRPSPRWDWYQTDSDIHILIYSNLCKGMKVSDVVLDVNMKSFDAAIEMDGWVYQLEIALSYPVNRSRVSIQHSKVDIILTKSAGGIRWETIGNLLPGNGVMTAKMNRDLKFRTCTIESISEETHDSKVFTLKLSKGSHMLVPTGYHVQLKAGSGSHTVVRSYTPVHNLLPTFTNVYQRNETIQLLIKLYSDGEMSQHLSKLSVGDTLSISDPQGCFDVSRLSGVTDTVLLAAGTGLTPMVDVIRHLLCQRDVPADHSVQLLFANKRKRDIIWKDDFDKLACEYSRFSMVNVLSDEDNSWMGLRGRINKKILLDHLPPPPNTVEEQKKLLICVCGPQPFTLGLSELLMDMKYPNECLHIFD